MPRLCGPMNSRFTYTGSRCPHLDLAVHSAATTLDAAIRDYETRFGAQITKHQDTLTVDEEAAAKYFAYLDLETRQIQLVDIHVFREGREICPKHDLQFPLEPDDVVEFGELIC